ncbi:efflux RND transporter periplasmic adaptor subunit [Porticoccus sp. GXU_MW_L64]
MRNPDIFRWPLCAALMLTVLASIAQEADVATVETRPAQLQTVAPKIWVPGTVIGRNDARIAAEVSGKLVQVAEVGARVDKGDVLARIGDHVLQLQLRDDQANIKSLQTNLAFLSRQVERVNKLARTNNTAEAELDRLQTEKAVLQQQVIAAKIRRDRTRYDIERTRITAPFAGIVVARSQRRGEYINTGDEVVRLVNLDQIEVSAQAPVSVYRHVQDQSPVRVKNDSEVVSTSIRRIVPVGDQRSRTLQVRVNLTAGPWVIGEAVKVELANGVSSERLTVPRDALILRERQTYVYRVGADNIARQIAVVTGEGAGDFIAVSGDITAGDRVVVRGGERLRDGQRVVVH